MEFAWLPCAVSLYLMIGLGASSRPNEPAEDPESSQTMRRITQLVDANDFSGLEKLATEIDARWRDQDPVLYATLTLRIARDLRSYDFGTDRRLGVSRQLAMDVFRVVDRLPPSIEVALAPLVLGWTGTDGKPVSGDDWRRLRHAEAEVQLRIWRDLSANIDPAFDPRHHPIVNDVPGEFGVPGGSSPDGIQDPVLRAKYELFLQRERQKLADDRRQFSASRIATDFKPHLREQLAEAYARPPIDPDELEGLMIKYGVDAGLRREILARRVEKSRGFTQPTTTGSGQNGIEEPSGPRQNNQIKRP